MYLSKLTLNPRSREVRRDLASHYELHRTVMRAFPSCENGGPGRVMFRIETASGDQPMIIVQSEKQPDWSHLCDADYALKTESKKFDIRVNPGKVLRFRLRANPTVKRKRDGKPDAGSTRHGLYKEEDQIDWLKRKAGEAGFQLLNVNITQAGTLTSRVRRAANVQQQTYFGVTYEGLLRVSDARAFAEAISSGIGPAKAFGFGLLSVAPV